MEKNIQDILIQLSINFSDKADNLFTDCDNGTLEREITYAKQEIYRQIADVLDETIRMINKKEI